MKFSTATLRELIHQYKASGLISDIVKADTNANDIKEKPTFQPLGSVGTGTTVMAPLNPVKPDGSVDFIIQIRGISGSDTKTASQIGSNAVIITAEAGGIGSKENLAAFGGPGFINSAIDKVLQQLQKQNPDKFVHRGKLTISSFSGGGSANANLLANRDQIKGGVDRFVFLDGLHADLDSSTMKKVVDYAKEVAKDPNKGQLDILHSAVQTSGYPSTTETAEHILKEVGAARQPIKEWKGSGPPPASEAAVGGLKVIQLYDKPDPYMLANKVNVPGTAGWQHIQSLKWGLDNLVGKG